MNNESQAEKPNRRCKVCHYKFWRQDTDGSWVCGVCHPKPNCDTPIAEALEIDNE
jgi:hypothetical protein